MVNLIDSQKQEFIKNIVENVSICPLNTAQTAEVVTINNILDKFTPIHRSFIELNKKLREKKDLQIKIKQLQSKLPALEQDVELKKEKLRTQIEELPPEIKSAGGSYSKLLSSP